MKSWEECYLDQQGTIYTDETFQDGAHAVRGLVMRGTYALTAYVGVPLDHPIAGWSYDLLPLEVHYGLTFASAGDDDPWPSNWWWYGWDYSHAFDATWLRQEMLDKHEVVLPTPLSSQTLGETTWTIEMILPEMRSAAQQLLILAKAGWQPSQQAQDQFADDQSHIAEFRANLQAGRLPDWLTPPEDARSKST